MLDWGGAIPDRESIRWAIVRLVESEPGLDSEDIAERLGRPVHEVCGLVAEMCEDGTLRLVGRGD